MMNGHEEIRTLLAAYSGGDLTAAERSRVEAHLTGCAACRIELAELETVHRLLRTTPQEEPPPWLTTRIMARVREQQQERQSWLQRFFLPLHVKLPLELAALLLVSVSGYYLARNVETELSRPVVQGEAPARAPQGTPPGPATKSETLPASKPRTSMEHPVEPAPPKAIERKEAAPAPEAPSEPASRPFFAPAPPPAREERVVPAMQPLHQRSMPADRQESVERMLPSAPKEAKKKTARSMEQEMPSLKAFDGALDKGAASVAQPITIRLRLDETAAAPGIVRDAIDRVGGVVVEDGIERHHSLKASIPAAQLGELFERLEKYGSVVERPQQRRQAGNLPVEIFW